MHKRFLHWPSLALAASVLATPTLVAPGLVNAQQTSSPSDKPAVSNLPLTDVVMFSSGVGYFQRDGQVSGDAEVTLKFPAEDINDLLKSMVVQDFGNGRINTINYTSRDPLTKALRSFGVDLTTNPTLGDLLNQIRGEHVTVLAPTKIEGVILGVERKTVPVKDKSLVVEQLNLLTEDGFKSVDLANVQAISLKKESLEKELRQALALLATGHDKDSKTVRLQFAGQGKRDVRVGYITESPVWKTSYRMVVKPEGDLFLQGWAIVENTTEEDWNKVNLTLVSGRPISFRMDLYQPLYVNRPLVEMELYASLRPQVYGQDMHEAEQQFRKMAAAPGAPPMADALAANRRANTLEAAQYAGRGAGKGEGKMRDEQRDWDLSQGGQSVSQNSDVGELFRYAIETPVTIARRQSAMLPIVNESIKGEKVSIYNESVQAKHPLNGLQITNSTPLHLMQGPITVFDGGVYAGDARIEDLTPGTTRLISYAMDLDTEVSTATKGHPEQLLSVKFYKGTLYVERKAKQSRSFTVKNSGSKVKKLLLEHPKNGDWKLVSPAKAEETTRDRYRFAVSAEPGKPATLDVVEERSYEQTVVVNNLDNNTIQYYVNLAITSKGIKDALAKVITLKNELNGTIRARQQLENEIREIEREQSRIRQNMPQLDRTSELFGRYVKKFTEQEDRIEQVRVQVEQLLKKENTQRKALDDYLYNIDLS